MRAEVVLGEVGLAGGGGPLLELVGVRDGRQHAGDRVLGEDELERRLRHRDRRARRDRKRSRSTFWSPPRATRVAGGCGGRAPGRSSRACTCPRAGRSRSARAPSPPTPLRSAASRKSRPGLLLEHVVDGLHRRDAVLLERAQSLVAPADRRSEGDAVVAQLALLAQPLELLEEVVSLDRVHARVVELVEVHVVGAEPAKARLERRACVLPVTSPAGARPASAPAGPSSST